MDDKVRIVKYIAQTGFCSRRKAADFVLEGRVKVNKDVVKELNFLVGDNDRVFIDDKQIKNALFKYVIYNKPAGYITTMSDENNRKTIYDILPPNLHKLKPVGRLDKDSTGLLLLTNDGDLINQMTHPSLKIPKVYRVCVDGKVTQQDIIKMKDGIEIEEGKIAYAYSTILEYAKKRTILEIVLYQGMNRQIRKIIDYLGFEVVSLKRITHGCLDIQGLKKGEFKYLKPKQVKDLKNYLKKTAAFIVK